MFYFSVYIFLSSTILGLMVDVVKALEKTKVMVMRKATIKELLRLDTMTGKRGHRYSSLFEQLGNESVSVCVRPNPREEKYEVFVYNGDLGCRDKRLGNVYLTREVVDKTMSILEAREAARKKETFKNAVEFELWKRRTYEGY